MFHGYTPTMATASETLSQLIERRLVELERSARTGAAMSHGLISHPYLSRLRRGLVPKVVEPKLAQGIALAIDVPVDQVMAAAGQPMTPGEFKLPARAQRLTGKERDAVLAVIDALLAARGALPAGTGKGRRSA